MALICNPLKISDVEHLLMCLLGTYVSYLEKCPFSSSAQFLLPLFVFFLLTCLYEFLYILDTNVWTDIWFANIFFHSTSCLFVLRSFPSLCRSFVVKFSVFYSCFCFPWLGSWNYKNIAKADITDRFFWNFMFSGLNRDEYMYSLWESSILILRKRGGV